jgi:trehalose-6-phosphatase
MTPRQAVSTLAATERLLVALDFDGTLSPLVDAPMARACCPRRGPLWRR